MRLELDLSPDDWDDYKGAGGDLKRVGVLTPVEPVGVKHFVRLGVLTDDGQAFTVMTPWLIWQAAHRALALRLGETPAPEPVEYEGVVLGEEAAPDPDPGVLPDIAAAIDAHTHRWGLGPGHPDGTDPDGWADLSKDARADATAAAMTGELTWAHTLLEAVHGALATEDPGELSQALAAIKDRS
ncbi:hypothetical protein [Nonomuraea sp. KM90]|uniref:hypothetical protein n=1 Tax=Nonomuraea sp. KM90 TaxID=3457428 RepID=UPI003FCE5193